MTSKGQARLTRTAGDRLSRREARISAFSARVQKAMAGEEDDRGTDEQNDGLVWTPGQEVYILGGDVICRNDTARAPEHAERWAKDDEEYTRSIGDKK